MTDRPLRVRIDRLVLRGVDSPDIGDMKDLLEQQLRRLSQAVTGHEAPIPRSGRAISEAAAARIAHEVRTRIAEQ